MPINGLRSIPPQYPAHFDIERVIRPNILALLPYRCARDDYKDGVLLDANENAMGHSISPSDNSATSDLDLAIHGELHRYPDPSHNTLKSLIATHRGLPSNPSQVFLGVGSDEVIDLLMRICVKPGGHEKILVTPPTYGMYSVCAQVNDIGVVKVDLNLSGENGEGGQFGRFTLRIDEIKKAVIENPSIKLIFLCSPGNPTGTLIPLSLIRSILEFSAFTGLVVVDEAYIDFTSEGADAASAVSLIEKYSNLVVMQTLSKSFGLAGIRLGIAFAQAPLIRVLSNTKAPYNISTPTALLALRAFRSSSIDIFRKNIAELAIARTLLVEGFARLPDLGTPIGSGDANFILVPVLDRQTKTRPDNQRAQTIYKEMAENWGVVVRYRGNEKGCDGCLRVTVGTRDEVTTVLKTLAVLFEQI